MLVCPRVSELRNQLVAQSEPSPMITSQLRTLGDNNNKFIEQDMRCIWEELDFI